MTQGRSRKARKKLRPRMCWFRTSATAMPSVIIAHVWRSFPFYAMSFLAGMQTIPLELYEAAQVDGASRWQQFRSKMPPNTSRR